MCHCNTTARCASALAGMIATLALAAVSVAQSGPPPGAPPGAPGGSASDSPIIDGIKFDGNTKIDSDRLATEVQLKPGAMLSREKMKVDLDRILALYRRAGYTLSVSPDITHPAPGHVFITFKIDETGVAGDAGPAPAAPAAATGTPPPGAPITPKE